MTKINLKEDSTTNKIKNTALKHYKQYVEYYASKNLKPMPFNEFFKNYSN